MAIELQVGNKCHLRYDLEFTPERENLLKSCMVEIVEVNFERRRVLVVDIEDVTRGVYPGGGWWVPEAALYKLPSMAPDPNPDSEARPVLSTTPEDLAVLPIPVNQFNSQPKLTVELVPRTSWFSNVRSRVNPDTWKKLRQQTYRKAKYVCEVCGGRGPKWPVECHEIWHYDDVSHMQKLTGLIALCPSCHEVKHIGLTQKKGRGDIARSHLVKVNNWTPEQVAEYLTGIWKTWTLRSEHDWKLDLTYLEQQGIKVELENS